MTHPAWDDGEFAYCCELVHTHGNANVGYDAKSIAAYLRMQASSAFGFKSFEIAARLGAAASAINSDARVDHAPDWKRASRALLGEA